MEDENTDIHELSGKTPEFRTELARQLEDLVPEAIADGKVDVAKLKELLDEDAGDTKERFGLFWPGKKRAMRAAQDPTTATLKPAKDESKDWDTTNNIFIEGDNLEVLKVLQKQYHNAIKMIYIDPPYNTGKDFVYPDNFKEGLANYLEFSQQVDAGNKKISTNTETAGRYHSNWLNMMYPRLKLARNLLTDDGVIFISIDDAEQPHLRKLCDEIFSEGNFIAQVVWERAFSPINLKHHFSTSHDYIIAYARKVISLPDFSLKRDEGADSRYKNPDNDQRGAWTSGDLSVGPAIEANIYPIINPAGRECYPPSGYSWRVSQSKFEELRADNRVWFGEDGSNVPRLKRYRSEVKDGIVPMTIWKYKDVGHSQDATKEVKDLFNGKAYFDYPKPVRLIKRLTELNTCGDDIVLDFFSGSGTTAHAVMQLNAEDGGNRKHIQVQLPEPTDEKSEAYKAGYRKISDIARERINRAGEKIKTDFADKLSGRDKPLDIGYRTYKLSDTNFTKWKSEATNDLGELQMRLDAMRNSSDDNASQDDLLVEVMLKLGLPLTSRTREREVSGLTVHQVAASADVEDSDTQPVLYLNEHVKPTLEQLRAIVTELTPSRFVILDDAFQGDSQLKTNLVQTCKSYDVELWTV
ncbi:MAG: site-specific DNA-methyltransferase [Candidatus Saccharimonadales bacterium]